MLRWALFFLLVGAAAGVLGYAGLTGAPFIIAEMLFFTSMLNALVLLGASVLFAFRIDGR